MEAIRDLATAVKSNLVPWGVELQHSKVHPEKVQMFVHFVAPHEATNGGFDSILYVIIELYRIV